MKEQVGSFGLPFCALQQQRRDNLYFLSTQCPIGHGKKGKSCKDEEHGLGKTMVGQEKKAKAGVEGKEQIKPDRFQNQVPCMNPAGFIQCAAHMYSCMFLTWQFHNRNLGRVVWGKGSEQFLSSVTLA